MKEVRWILHWSSAAQDAAIFHCLHRVPILLKESSHPESIGLYRTIWDSLDTQSNHILVAYENLRYYLRVEHILEPRLKLEVKANLLHAQSIHRYL